MLKWIDVIKFVRYGSPAPNHTIVKSPEEWKTLLTPDQYKITREKGTEAPFSAALNKTYFQGEFACSCCSALLFSGNDYYDSGSGWPAFTQPYSPGAIKYEADYKLSKKRVEVLCNVCDSHLGHVFPDGPAPSGLRYCINSLSITYRKNKISIAVLGGGCFWCIEALLQNIKGVESAESGFSGGTLVNPTYKEVSSGLTGHAEVVRIKFNSDILSYEKLLELFFLIHNPTLFYETSGHYSQYRSIILYTDEYQKEAAEGIKKELSVKSGQPFYTQITPFTMFYLAEEKHQNYFLKDPEKAYCKNIISPKILKLQAHLYS